jgi:aerobic carbon-monoxide dehydrogenase medium subunit
MKPPAFEYHAPDTLDEALALLAKLRGRAMVLAGGQTLLQQLALRSVHPEHVVDINGLTEIANISQSRQGLVLGGMVRQRVAERSRVVQGRCPLMAEAIPLIAHPPIRNRGTIGGSLAYANPAAELPTVIAALEAELVVRSRRRRRILKPETFFVGYEKTALQPDEILCEVRVPPWPKKAGWSYLNLSRRYGDFAVVGVATFIQIGRGGLITEARLALGSVADVPVRARAAERLLVGQRPGADLFGAVADQAVASLQPRSDILASAAYRLYTAKVLTRRSLETAVKRAEKAA